MCTIEASVPVSTPVCHASVQYLYFSHANRIAAAFKDGTDRKSAGNVEVLID